MILDHSASRAIIDKADSKPLLGSSCPLFLGFLYLYSQGCSHVPRSWVPRTWKRFYLETLMTEQLLVLKGPLKRAELHSKE